jgi:DNA polymerase III sliding clamp (beta) subunit (PCNA family)
MRVLEEELERIKHVDVEMKKNKRVLDDEYKIILKQIDDEFRDIYQMIERKHNETRQRAIDAFSRATGVNDTGVHEVSWWKELLIKTRGTLPKPSQN